MLVVIDPSKLRSTATLIARFSCHYNKLIKVAGNSFQYFSRLKSLMGHYNHSIPIDANIMVSINCPIIGKQVAVNFVAQ